VIINSNRAYFVKMVGRGFQEILFGGNLPRLEGFSLGLGVKLSWKGLRKDSKLRRTF
jgi:hypothetical protein